MAPPKSASADCIGLCHPLLFADDTKCFKTISRWSDISTLNQLSTCSCLLFNESKSVHLQFWKQFVWPLQRFRYQNLIKSQFLNLYYETISAKVYKMLRLPSRSFVTHTSIIKEKLYMLDPSLHSYCLLIWQPFLHIMIFCLSRRFREEQLNSYILNNYNSSHLIQLTKALPIICICLTLMT